MGRRQRVNLTELAQLLLLFSFYLGVGCRAALTCRTNPSIHQSIHPHMHVLQALTSELVSHEDDGDVLADTAQATAVNLAELHSARLQELLEHDAVLALLACSYPDTQRVESLHGG